MGMLYGLNAIRGSSQIKATLAANECKKEENKHKPVITRPHLFLLLLEVNDIAEQIHVLTPQSAAVVLTNSSLLVQLPGFLFSNQEYHNFAWKPSHKHHFAPNPPKYPPWCCCLVPWRHQVNPASTWLRGNGGVEMGTGAGFVRFCFSAAPEGFAPVKAHPDRTLLTAPLLGVLLAHVEEAGEWETGIFSIDVEFHTFSEMIFQFLPFFFLPLSFPCNCSWCF